MACWLHFESPHTKQAAGKVGPSGAVCPSLPLPPPPWCLRAGCTGAKPALVHQGGGGRGREGHALGLGTGLCIMDFWWPSGGLLGACWGPAGDLLGAYWEPTGSLLGAYWEPTGSLLGLQLFP